MTRGSGDHNKGNPLGGPHACKCKGQYTLFIEGRSPHSSGQFSPGAEETGTCLTCVVKDASCIGMASASAAAAGHDDYLLNRKT